MIDIHSHILPGIDDGSGSMEETAKMMEIAVQEGIDVIIATPHYEVGLGEGQMEKYAIACQKMEQYLQEHPVPLQIYCGNEIYYSEGVVEALQNGEICTMNESRYVLVEFPVYESYQYIERAIYNLQNAGYWVIIAHAERYSALQDMKRIRFLVKMGVYVQVNASSVIGKSGWKIKAFCLQLMKQDLIHFVATDSHGSKHRRPLIQECLEYIDKKMGSRYRKKISETNPQKIIKGEIISEKN